MKKEEKGQIILILVLVMTVALAIGISVIQRSLSDISTATKVEQSSRAFSAAEAGIEKALRGDATAVSFPENNSSATVTGTDLIPAVPADGTRQDPLEYPNLAKEEIAHVWLADPDSATNPPAAFYKQPSLDIYWGNSNFDQAALELTLVYYNGSQYTTQNTKWYLDHTNQSLFSEGKNAFYSDDKKYHLSDYALQFIAGQLGHIKGMNAIINPTVNSYKRLVVGYEAPVYISWGQTNRSALMRIPRVNPDKPQTTRCELRCPDPTCNPYLAYAVMLSAGLDGIENKLQAPEPIEESTYEMTPEEIVNRGIDTVSRDLYSALLAMKDDKMINDVLGKEMAKRYYEIKMSEWDDFRLHVSEWERERYLEVY